MTRIPPPIPGPEVPLLAHLWHDGGDADPDFGSQDKLITIVLPPPISQIWGDEYEVEISSQTTIAQLVSLIQDGLMIKEPIELRLPDGHHLREQSLLSDISASTFHVVRLAPEEV